MGWLRVALIGEFKFGPKGARLLARLMVMLAGLAGLAAQSGGHDTSAAQSVAKPSLTPRELREQHRAQQTLSLPVIGQLGGPVNAVKVVSPYAYIGMGPRLVVVDISDPARCRIVGLSAILPGIVTDVEVVEGRAYVTTSAFVDAWIGGLAVVDVTTPQSPRWVGSLPIGLPAAAVQVTGDRAFLTAGWTDAEGRGRGALIAVDITDGAKPQQIGQLDLPPGIQTGGLAVQGTMAYVAGGRAGLQIIDVGNPPRMRTVAVAALPNEARAVAVSGTMVYVAGGYAGLLVVDVATAAEPRLVVEHPALVAEAIDVADDRVYLAGSGNLKVFSISDPLSPWLVSSADMPGAAADVDVLGGVAYIAIGVTDAIVNGLTSSLGPIGGGLVAVDVSAAGLGRQLGAIDTIGDARAVQLSGDRAYLAGGDARRFDIIDVGNPAVPMLVGSLPLDGRVVDLHRSGHLVYVGVVVSGADNEFGGVWVIDVSHPETPVPLGVVYTDSVSAVFAQNQFVYVATDRHGLQIIDASTPAQPHVAGQLDLPADLTDVEVTGRYAYVVGRSGALRIVDVSVPDAPILVGVLDGLGSINHVRIRDGRAYLAAGGLRVVDVALPTSPRLLGTWAGPSCADLAVTGSLVYLACRDGVTLIDADDPLWLKVLGNAAVGHDGEAQALAMQDGLLYRIGAPLSGLVVLALEARSSPTAAPPVPSAVPTSARRDHQAYLPVAISSLNLPRPVELGLGGSVGGAVSVVRIMPPLAYVGMGARLGVVDIGDPRNARLIDQSPPLSAAVTDLAVDGARAFVLTADQRLHVLGLGTAMKPRLLGDLRLPADGLAVRTEAGRVYVQWADGERSGGLWIIDPTVPDRPQLLGGLDFPYGTRRGVFEVYHGMVYTNTGSASVEIIDARSPDAPRLLDQASLPHDTSVLCVADDRLYLFNPHEAWDPNRGANASGLWIYDLATPAAPRPLGRFEVPALEYVMQLRVADGRAYMTGQWPQEGGRQWRLATMDVSQLGASNGLTALDLPGEVSGVAVDGDIALLAGGSAGGLRTVDVSAPEELRIIGDLPTLAPAQRVTALGSMLYLTDPIHDGFQVVDASLPTSPRLVRRVATRGFPVDLTLAPDRIYVAAQASGTEPGGLRIYDATQAANPRLLGEMACSVDGCGAVAASGPLAFVVAGTQLWTVDVSDPAVPRILSQLETGTLLRSVQAVGPLVYATASLSGVTESGEGVLWVLDVSKPEAPRRLGRALTWGLAGRLQVVGSTAYVTVFEGSHGPAGLAVFDLGDPANPRLAGRAYVGAIWATGLHVAENTALMTAFERDAFGWPVGKLVAIDVSNPRIPRVVASLPTRSRLPIGLALVGDVAYLADAEQGLIIAHRSFPAIP